MDRPLLNDATILPEDAVLEAVLKDCNKVYQEFEDQLPNYQIELEWRYYNDSKCWLGKSTTKKKTIFWLSVWQGFFRVSFYFTEKTRVGIMALPISDEVKIKIENEPVKGKLILLFFDISEKAQLKDVFTVIAYKQSCK